jgi:NAD(P)-dependent dehydrogenase (short-subunit alcohol dehydrogenase family)
MKLDKRTVVVTGSSNGIGRGIAIAFAEEGANVVLASRSEQSSLEEDDRTTTEVIIKSGGDALFHQTDVTVEADVQSLMETAVEEYNSIDVLVNNAGVTSSNPIHKVTDEEWDQVHDVNLKSVYRCSKYAIPHIRNSDCGRIINISSQRGIPGGAPPEKAAYVSSKGAVSNLTRQMALDYGPEGIAVNAICPGPVFSGMTRIDEPADRERLLSGVLTDFIGEPEDIAPAAVLLVSEEGRFVHGQNIVIDGGYAVKPAGQ